ncbi:SprT-like domain-containing protein [Paenibacillus medicaginis]|uniref:SprT-like domain-containing protein n=1 Tax=Paenibacillus medicaginis TaxID=1470560 RepID=A0ABV5BV45_9BACL
MPEVTLEWLNKQAKQLVKKHWNLNEIPTITIDLERKDLNWTTAVGYYCNDIKTIAFNSEVNKRRTEREIKRTLLHELCHWYLHTTGQKFRDSDERFAREMIRVGLGQRYNRDEQAVLAAKEAWKSKNDERFEIIEKNSDETITFRLKHRRKDQDDFEKDLAQVLIRMHNDRVKQNEDYSILPGDVAQMMVKWYGYKLEPIAACGIVLSRNDGWGGGEVGGRDDIISVLEELGIDTEEAEMKLLELDEEELYTASEIE